MPAAAIAALDALDLPAAQEKACALRRAPDNAAPGPAVAIDRPPSRLLDRGADPAIDGLRIRADTVARVRDRARAEGTTMHGALSAALMLAGRWLSRDWGVAPVRLISPVNTRRTLGTGDDFVLSILFPSGAYDPGAPAARQFRDVSTSFQQIARLVETTTEAAREIELSTKQQTTAVEQVNEAIASVAQASRESEVGSAQTLQAVTELTNIARDLTKFIQPRMGA